jgi:DeoR family transcriptional regulator, fructose operon transcriptional repressor
MSIGVRQRREDILTQLYAAKEVSASALARQLSVSEATVRRDLRALARDGQLVLSYGGAVLARNTDFSYRSKSTRSIEAKRIIGALAASFVNDGDQVFLDSGTTCATLAPHLRSKRGISVIANSARLALELDSPHLSVILLGGQYRYDRMDTVGPLAQAALEQLRGYVAFLGADGLSLADGLSAADVESAFLFRRAAENAPQVLLLAGHTKFLAPSLCRVVGWDSVDVVVTDRAPSAQWADFFAQRNITVVTPGQSADSSPQAKGPSP